MRFKTVNDIGVARESLAGHAPDATLWELQSYDLAYLREDLHIAIRGWCWEQGCFGHSLPLTANRLTSFGAAHHNNLVHERDGVPLRRAPDKLAACRYFRGMFESFQCGISSFRVLRRPGLSSYTLHADRDMGDATFRFQIPIESGSEARLLVTNARRREQFVMPEPDHSRVENWRSPGIGTNAMQDWLEEFVRLNDERVRLYAMEPGRLYHFDSRNYHNLLNFSADDRYTLAIDLVANDWLREQFPGVPLSC